MLPPISFPTLGWQVIDWIENQLCHGPGDIQGQRIQLDDSECCFLCWAYRLDNETGRRVVHRAIYSRPKGRRKSELAAMVACAEALGPVRFDGWDANGDPVGKRVVYPYIRILATEEGQAGNVYDAVAYMLKNGDVANNFAVDVGLTRTFVKEDSGGLIVPCTAGSASKDGGKETFAVGDETHLFLGGNLKTMYRTVARNTGKRSEAQPWMMDTTTAFMPGEDSIAEQAAGKYLSEPTEDAVVQKGVLYDHTQGTVPKRFGDDRSLIKALRPAYGAAAAWMDLSKICRVIRDAEDPEAEAYRYFLNIPRAGTSQWIEPQEIEAVLGEVGVEPDQKVCLGFDGSDVDDHTVLMGCNEQGRLFTIGYWTPAEEELGWRDEVNGVVKWCMDYFKVVRFYADPPFWQSELSQWARTYGSPPVTEFWTNYDTKMAVATGALRTAIRNEQDPIVIDPIPLRTAEKKMSGKTLLAWHFQNAKTRKVRIRLEDRSEEAWIVRKERPGSPLKIDSVPSAILARRARDDALKAQEFEVPTFSRAAW